MNAFQSLYLYISCDKSEVLISRSGMVHEPLGFSAPIGKWIRFSHDEFFSQCVSVISVLLDEDPLWHDKHGNSVTNADSNTKKMSPSEKRYFKKFKEMDVTKGGAGPPGITVTGSKSIDEIRFSFLESDSSNDVAKKFGVALIKSGWWER